MGVFVYIGHDGPEAPALRPVVRDRHLAHLEPFDRAGRIRFAGPLRDATGAPRGSLIVLEAADLAEARRIAESDPYFREGVFARVDVHESLQVFPRSAG
jgi:uncharacterized protein YciI